MRIDDQEYVVIHSFSFHGKDYVVYTLDDKNNVVYLSRIQYHEHHISLEKIDTNENQDLKKVMAIFLQEQDDTVFLKESQYHTLSRQQLTANKIELHDFVLIRMSDQKYNTFVTKKI